MKLYMARITTGVSDVCPECGVATHSVEHLFNCSVHPTPVTVQDLWDNPAEVADFLNLDSWRQWTRTEELLGYHNNNKHRAVSLNWPKIESRRPMVTPHLLWKFHANLSSRLLVILLKKNQKGKNVKSGYLL